MMKVLQFDKFGRFIRSFNSKEEAKATTGNRWLYRNLYREIDYTEGSIFVFENDERIRCDIKNKKITLDCVECFTRYTSQYEIIKQVGGNVETVMNIEGDYTNLIPVLKPVEKKFDNIPLRIECYSDGKKVGTYNSVAEARRITGAPCIWCNLFGECKKTSNLVFRAVRE